jgi:hypothetical protein
MSRTSREAKASVAAALLTALACGLSSADDKPAKGREGKADAPKTIAGVVVKVETYQDKGATAGKSGPESWVVTVKTDAVWRDFVRDQAVAPEKAAKISSTRAASKGRKSVANEGQPLDPNQVATAALGGKTKLALRYRSSTDEATKGAKTPEGAVKAEEAVDPSARDASPALAAAGKPKAITTKDLKPGLWVEIELTPGDSKHAQALTVLQPVEDVKVPAEPAGSRSRPK